VSDSFGLLRSIEALCFSISAYFECEQTGEAADKF
jgi:hypothetical protein